jgi:hypothetical protein
VQVDSGIVLVFVRGAVFVVVAASRFHECVFFLKCRPNASPSRPTVTPLFLVASPSLL